MKLTPFARYEYLSKHGWQRDKKINDGQHVTIFWLHPALPDMVPIVQTRAIREQLFVDLLLEGRAYYEDFNRSHRVNLFAQIFANTTIESQAVSRSSRIGSRTAVCVV